MYKVLILLVAVLFAATGCSKNENNSIPIHPISEFNDIDLKETAPEVKSQITKWINEGYKLYYKDSFVQNNKNKELLLFSKPVNDVVSSSEIVGMVIVYNSNYKWQIEIKSASIICESKWGRNPATKLTRIGKDSYAIVFSIKDQGQGYYLSYMSFVTITNKGFVECLAINTKGDNSGTGSTLWSYNMTLDIIPSNKEYYDIEATVSGKGDYKTSLTINAIDGKMLSKLNNGKMRLSYVNGKYI